MWIQQLLAISSMSVCRSGCPIGSHAWILIAMFQLAMDFTICESVAQGQEFRLLQKPFHWHRVSHSPLWSFKNGQQLRIPDPFWNYVSSHPERSHGQIQTYHSKRPHKATDQLAGLLYKSVQSKHFATAKSAPSVVDGSSRNTDQQTHSKREKRHLRGRNFDYRDSRPTMVPEVIVWGPTGEEDSIETSTFPGNYGTTTTSALQTRTTTVATTTTTTTTSTTVQSKGFTASPVPGINTHKNNPGRISTTEPYTSHKSNGKEARPPKIPGETSGLAVHQIITITVSLIMVIAALITTLVLKNCCVQSGNTRRNSHQRKINQQEESCQNLTDFTPARVPSNLDIFTAYNETLQCSHECVRAPMPVYTEEMLHSPADYKTTFNGNRIPLVNL